jgi:LemA protein
LITVPPASFTNSIFYHKQKKAQWEVSAAEKEKNEQAPEVKF